MRTSKTSKQISSITLYINKVKQVWPIRIKPDGTFIIQMQPEQVEILKSAQHLRMNTLGELYAQTMSQIREVGEQAAKFLRHADCKKEKVIVFELNLNGYAKKPDGCIEFAYKDIGWSDDRGIGLLIKWRVREMRTTDGHSSLYSIESGNYKDQVDKERQKILPWTEERQKFFEDMEASLLNMIRRARIIKEMSNEQFALAINNDGLSIGWDKK